MGKLSMDGLRKSAAERPAIKTKKTLASFEGKEVIVDLPGAEGSKGLYEVVLKDVVLSDTSLTLIVTEAAKQYKIALRTNDYFAEQVSPLFAQLELSKIKFSDLKTKIGETFLVAASDNVTDRGVFTNYRFDENSLKAKLLDDTDADDEEEAV